MLKKTTKRFISIVMAAMMITSMIPFTAFAADETTASDNAETTNAIGGTIEKVADTDTWYSDATREFMTRETFWNDQVSGQPDTYTVNQNSKIVSIGSAEALVWWAKQVNSGTSFAGYTINITANIDLSAYYWTPICTGTVSYTTGGKYSIANNTTLAGTTINGNGHTITGLATQTGVRGPNQDSKPGDGQNCYYDAAFIGYSCCNITINNLTFDGARIAISEPFGEVTQTYGSSMMAVIVGAQTGGSLTLNKVTVNNADVLAMQKAAAFVANLMGNSTLTVNNCAITNSRFSAYFQVAPISSYSTTEQVTIKGIKLENNHVRMVDQSWPKGYYQDPNNGSWYIDEYGDSVDINACTTAMFRDGTNAAITNDTLSGTGTAWTPVASVDGYMYASLEDALNAAEDGDTIKLLEDVTVSSPISTKKTLTFEGITKADGTKPVIRSADANGLFSQAGDAVYTIKNLTLETSSDGQWYIYHSANTLTIENCDFIMAEGISNTGKVVMGEGNPSTDEDYALIFKNNTITANSRAALTGVGNNSVISENIINLLNEKHGSSESRTSIIALTAVAEKGAVTISNNTFKNANRAIAVDNSSLSASDLTIKNNQFINVRFAFELSPTQNANQGIFDLSKNYYNFNDTVSALKVQDADSEGDKFNFGEGSSEYLPEGTNLVIAEPYYTAPTMKDEDLNTYVPPTTGGGSTVIPTPDPEPEKPSDSEDTVTNPDGSTTTTITKEDGSSSTTTVGTDGKVESEVTVSEEAVSNADGSAVTLPMPEVAVTSDKDTAATVTVNLPSKDATKVEVPVKDVTAGTVAVLVDADGNETVIKDTVQSDNGITVEVTDGTTIKVVDNSKTFDDVADNYWGADAIDFATSRELFAGTAENTFSPEGDMTRAMIWSVLARYEGADTPGGTGDTWYAGPQKWAMENGISDGTMANSAMTREQFAAMLYRYVGSPAVSGTVGNYSDADSISSWAQDAMVWAVQQGLIAGMDDGTLNPQGTATRTQVAAIFQRFIENQMA